MKLKILILLVIPIILIFVAAATKQTAGPYWLGSNSDPEYSYLFNSLNLSRIKSIQHIHHPGTTLQVFGAGIIQITHVFRSNNQLVDDVLKNPELYLNIINESLVILIGVSFFIVGYLTFKLTGKFSYSLIIQVAPFLSLTTVSYLHRANPELVLILIAPWFSYLVLFHFFNKKIESPYPLIFLEAISGFAIATKINSAPFILIPLLFLSFKKKIIYLVTTFAFLIFFTLPIYYHYIRFIEWISKLIIHTDIYGGGPATVINYQSFTQNIVTIISGEIPLTLTVVVIAAFTLLLLFKRRGHGDWKYFVGILIFYFVEVTIVAKHYLPHYLIPTTGLAGLSIILLLTSMEKSFPGLFSKIEKVIVITIFAFAINTGVQIINKHQEKDSQFQEAVVINNIIKTFDNPILISYYRSSSPIFALKFGNDWSYRYYKNQLSKLYPDTYFYDIWNGKFYNWTGETKLPKERTILLHGTSFDNEDYLIYKPKFNLKRLYKGKSESLYLLYNDSVNFF